MRVLLSSVGTRGDVQPIVAVAARVRELGHEVRLCVPPNFVSWVKGLGLEAVPVGVEMRMPAGRTAASLTPEELKRLRESMPDLITDQFEALERAAEGCDVILGANAHQYAAPSIAELRGVPYFVAVYAPVAIPSSDHPPPPPPGQRWAPADPAAHLAAWAENLRGWNARALERVNHNRARRGLPAIDDVLRHNLGDRPWIAADPLLAPVPHAPGLEVTATGAWIFEDATPLPRELEVFLEAGEAPIYFGFGSMPAPPGAAAALVAAARELGRRAIVSQGWAEMAALDGADCVTIGDVSHAALFPRVAAIVHHGGAGTTAAAARSGAPQVVVPMFSDQFYWASRVRALGIGGSVEGALDAGAMAVALREALSAGERAREIAGQLGSDGASIAARRLTER